MPVDFFSQTPFLICSVTLSMTCICTVRDPLKKIIHITVREMTHTRHYYKYIFFSYMIITMPVIHNIRLRPSAKFDCTKKITTRDVIYLTAEIV